jgi:uncharacterized protein YkwD
LRDLGATADVVGMARRLAPLACAVGMLVPAAALLSAGASANGTHQSHKSTAVTVDLGVLQQLNEIRRAHHLVPLTVSADLSAAARQHSDEMLAKGYFAHNSSNGDQFWQRIESFYPEPRSGYWSVGENLYWTPGPATAAGSLKAWMASPPHRANILDPAWRQIGIAAVSSADAPGTFGNLGATVITTDFGVRT